MPEGFFTHPTALAESDQIGKGTRIWAYAHVMKGAVVGRDCKIGDHAFIESGATLGDRVTVKNGCLIWHGVMLGDEVFVGPGVVFTNDMAPRVRHQTGPEDWLDTVVESGASIGANSTIVCGIKIGHDAMIGSGSVITRDVPSHALVYGNPGRQHGWVCECGQKLSAELVCPKCGGRYERSGGGLEASSQSGD